MSSTHNEWGRILFAGESTISREINQAHMIMCVYVCPGELLVLSWYRWRQFTRHLHTCRWLSDSKALSKDIVQLLVIMSSGRRHKATRVSMNFFSEQIWTEWKDHTNSWFRPGFVKRTGPVIPDHHGLLNLRTSVSEVVTYGTNKRIRLWFACPHGTLVTC